MATLIRSVDELISATDEGREHGFTFFWGHTPAKDGRTTNACFSQWWQAPFTVDAVTYQTAEHFMMAAKASLFGDEENRQRIIAAGHPKEAKEIGRKVKGFDDKRWEEERFQLVVAGNLAKFSQNAPLREFLLSTGEQILVEASPADRIWGIGLTKDDPNAKSPKNWRGLNLLGFALMEVRGILLAA